MMRTRVNRRDEGLGRTIQRLLTARHSHRFIVVGLFGLSALMELTVLRFSHHRLDYALTESDLHLSTRRALSFRETKTTAGLSRRQVASFYAFRYRATKSERSWRDAKIDFFANNGFSLALQTTSAMGEHAESANTTFLVYQGPHEDPFIVSFEHATNTWIGPVHVGTSMLGQLTDPLVPVDPTSRSAAASTSSIVGNNRGQPSIVIDSKGYLHVTYGGDGGDEQFAGRLVDGLDTPTDDYGSGRVIHASSRHPYDIREWTTHTSRSGSPLSWRGSDCQFVKAMAGDQSNHSVTSPGASSVELYHFCRHGYQAASITYQRSTDDGETWSKPFAVLETQGAIKADRDDDGAIFVVSDGWSCRFRAGSRSARHIIAAACSYNRFRTGPDTRTDDDGRAQLRKKRTSALPALPPVTLPSSYNAYYLELDTRSQTWRNVRGQVLDGLPLNKERADVLLRALDTETPLSASRLDVNAFIRPVAVTISRPGRPHFMFQAPVPFINPSGTDDTSDAATLRHQKKLWYLGWTGSAWAEPAMVVSPDETGSVRAYDEDGDLAVTVDGNGEEVVTVTTSLTNQTHSVVQNFASLDQGRTWNRTDEGSGCWVAIRNHHGRFHTSSYVINGRPEARMVAYLEEPVTRQSNMAYRKLYLIGTDGPVLRTRRDAEVCRGVKTSEVGSMCSDFETTSEKLR
jgi:hypothetical protein